MADRERGIGKGGKQLTTVRALTFEKIVDRAADTGMFLIAIGELPLAFRTGPKIRPHRR